MEVSAEQVYPGVKRGYAELYWGATGEILAFRLHTMRRRLGMRPRGTQTDLRDLGGRDAG